ncbi:MAG: MxaS protein [Burkholderiales bacterium]
MVQEFHYRVPWRARGYRPGHHKGQQGGGGLDFRGHAPLLDMPDPRRLDVLASLRDPFETWKVRVYSQRTSVPVYLLADVSASMAFHGRHRKLDVLADFALSLGYSTYRTGDPFGCIACDDRVREEALILPTHAKGAGMIASRQLRAIADPGRSAEALVPAAAHLARHRSLVFIASDFHFPATLLDAILSALARHEVVPIVMWDRAEFEDLPAFGLALLEDPESGRRRTLWLRPRLRERIAQAYDDRRARLARRFLDQGMRPFFMIGEFRADALSEFFLGEGTPA